MKTCAPKIELKFNRALKGQPIDAAPRSPGDLLRGFPGRRCNRHLIIPLLPRHSATSHDEENQEIHEQKMKINVLKIKLA
jgi:hypothetical protein